VDIDPRTLAVTIVFISALLGGLQIFSWAQNRSGKDLLLWGLIFLLVSLAVGLLTLQGHAPEFISTTLGDGLLVLAHGLLYSSTRIFNRKPPVFLGGALGAFAWLIAAESHLFVTSVAATSIFVSLLIGSYSFLLASEFRQMAKEKLPSSTAAAVLAIAHGMFFFGRAVVILLRASNGQPVAFAESWSAVLALEAIMAIVALGYVLPSLSKERIALQFRGEALTDDLTGIANRRAFFEAGEEMVLECKRLRQTVSLILVDLDSFKEINDGQGHLAGDKILRAVATCIASSLPSGAVVARLGGDEFAVLLPTMGLRTAGSLADHIRERIDSLAFVIDGANVQATVSMGVAESTEGLINLIELISAADTAVYVAKSKGRNRVEIHSLTASLPLERSQAAGSSVTIPIVERWRTRGGQTG
jgi:diguanylate cyclase (GGDEF)-like protein